MPGACHDLAPVSLSKMKPYPPDTELPDLAAIYWKARQHAGIALHAWQATSDLSTFSVNNYCCFLTGLFHIFGRQYHFDNTVEKHPLSGAGFVRPQYLNENAARHRHA